MDEIIQDNIQPEETSRKLASIQRILKIEPIVFINAEGKEEIAGNISLATIQGWTVVINKNDFKIGDLCVFFEIDSLLPFRSWSEFLRNKDKHDKPIRIKTAKKLKVALSQGLAIPLSAFPELNPIEFGIDPIVGQDVTEILGVTKYEPLHIDFTLRSQCRGNRPHWVQKTDESRIQSNMFYFDEFKGKLTYISRKMDGSSASFGYFNKEFHVCSRNMDYINTKDNAFWRVANKYNIEEILKNHFEKTGQQLLIQGELVGPTIQKNRLSLKELDLYVFNVINIDGYKDFNYEEMINFCNINNIKHVPIIGVYDFTWTTVDELLEMANKDKYDNGYPSEGLVFRPIIPSTDKWGGRLSFKCISNEYLLKTGD